jgi:hypothetical protein
LLKSAIVTASAPGGKECCLIDQIGKIGASEAWGKRGDLFRIDVLRELRPLHVNLKDLYPALLVRSVDKHLPVESPGPKQCRVEDLWAVGRA